MSVRPWRILVVVAIPVALLAGMSRCVWLPDVVSPRAHVLASASSQSGHRFQVVQYWNGADFYTTELEDLRPDGHLNVTQIDWDDMKQWSSAIRVIEEEKKLIITSFLDSRIWQYRWDIGAIVAPYDRTDIPFMLHTRQRSALTKSGEIVRRTQSVLTKAGARADSEP